MSRIKLVFVVGVGVALALAMLREEVNARRWGRFIDAYNLPDGVPND